VAVAVALLIVTLGLSSLTIVTVAFLEAVTVYAGLAWSVATTVSLTSTAVSLVGLTVMSALGAPAGITTLRASV
jgi:hypothetical protein